MANCQNPMRYGRQTPMYTQRSTCNTCGSVRQNPRPVQQECPRPQESQVTRPFSDCRERIDRVEHLPENCKVHVHKATAPKIHYGKCLLLWHMFLGRDGRKSTMYATDFNEELFSVNWINRSMGKEDAIDE